MFLHMMNSTCTYVCNHCSVVRAFENLVSALVQRENFTGIVIVEKNIAIRIEQVRKHTLLNCIIM